jgi:hypothetical protein
MVSADATDGKLSPLAHPKIQRICFWNTLQSDPSVVTVIFELVDNFTIGGHSFYFNIGVLVPYHQFGKFRLFFRSKWQE